jgi:hypothetical protein
MESDRVFAGVDLSAGKFGPAFALLTNRLDVTLLGIRTVREVADELASRPGATVAFCGPLRPFSPMDPPAEEGTENKKRTLPRAAERDLIRRGIPTRRAPPSEERAPAWMRAGFDLRRALAEAGYGEGKEAGPEAPVMMEVHPSACASALLGKLTFPRETLEGRIQRQLLLLRERVALPDPMEALEELTAHHILSGHLVLNGIRSPAELDALLAAYTAWRARTRPETVTWLGDDTGGWLCVPAKELLKKYTR